MTVLEVIEKRRSIRKFKKVKVDEETLSKVLEAARLSPSADNKQPWRFIVLKSEEVKKKLKIAYGADWFIQAPVIIVACAVPDESWCRADGEEYWKVDVAISMQSLILTATDLGLGTCWIADFNEALAKLALDIPEGWRVVAMTPLGYPAEESKPIQDRKHFKEITVFKG